MNEKLIVKVNVRLRTGSSKVANPKFFDLATTKLRSQLLRLIKSKVNQIYHTKRKNKMRRFVEPEDINRILEGLDSLVPWEDLSFLMICSQG